MNKKILVFAILGIFLVSFVSASIFTNLWDNLTSKEKQTKTLEKLNITDDFNSKILKLDTTGLCIKDQYKTVKDKNCELKKPKDKYSTINISNSNYFHQNSQGVVRFNNE